jgi:hypothetical protein
MNSLTPSFLRWVAAPRPAGPPGYLVTRWIFLRALGLIYFSAFYSFAFQIRGLMGPHGLLPAGEYLEQVAGVMGHARYWYAPTLLWLGSGPMALEALCWAGMAAAALLTLNFWPRGMLIACLVSFLSMIAAAQDFSGYQSDGMLLSAGFVSIFFAPPGWRPRWGGTHPPSRGSMFLLQWVWFTIYFESGVAKMMGGDPQWRNFTAMDEYYQNGPLPTWIGWYVQHLPHWFHAGATLLTLGVELGLVWMLFLPRRFRTLCFLIVTPFEIGIILTANYTFLNYLVLTLGFLLLDDRFLVRFLPKGWATAARRNLEKSAGDSSPEERNGASNPREWFTRGREAARAGGLWLSMFLMAWVFYATVALLLRGISGTVPLPSAPVVALEPFRIANSYGLFGIMTRARYEIEFQGSNDGATWIAYPFRYKPQDVRVAPGIYAPYQPRFDWNLWFASLGGWRENPFVVRAEEALLTNEPDVLALFAGNPFAKGPPREVRAVIWQYWFTDLATKRTEGLWWRREMLGLYAPTLARDPDGRFQVVEWPHGRIAPP